MLSALVSSNKSSDVNRCQWKNLQKSYIRLLSEFCDKIFVFCNLWVTINVNFMHVCINNTWCYIKNLILYLSPYTGITNHEEYSLVRELPDDEKEKTLTLRRDRSIAKDQKKLDELKKKLHTDDECEFSICLISRAHTNRLNNIDCNSGKKSLRLCVQSGRQENYRTKTLPSC